MDDDDLSPPSDPPIVNMSQQEIDQKIKEIEEFLASVDDLKCKLTTKKQNAHLVVKQKMADLHQLIDKWEGRFLDTITETIDEKIESLTKQAEKLKALLDFVQADRLRLAGKKPEDIAREEAEEQLHIERMRQKSLLSNDEDDDDDDEDEDNDPIINRRKMLQKFSNIVSPLQPEGVSAAEATADLWGEFGNLLDETRKSLKRSLLFAGGIIRGYMRRGHKKDEWITMLRRLESRFEASERPDAFIVTPTPSLSSYYPRLVKSSSDYASYNVVWKTVGDIYKYRDNIPVRSALCKQMRTLYENHPAQVEFYLPQLINVWLMHKDFKELGYFILTKCSDAPHIAINVYFFVCSMGQVGPPKWQKRCYKILKKVVKAVPYEDGTKGTIDLPDDTQENADASGGNPGSPTPSKDKEKRKSASRPRPVKQSEEDEDPEQELARLTKIEPPPKPPRVDKGIPIPAGKEYFFRQIEFLRKLIDISRKLGELYGKKELYKPELDKELAKLQPFIDTGDAYLPYNGDTRLRVLRFVTDDCQPIPTYGRVLYRMIVESVALPANYTKQMAEEYIRLSQDIATVGAASGTITPSHQYVVDAFAGDTNNRSRPPSLEFKFTYSDAPSPSLEDSRPPRIREGSLFGESWKEARKRLKAQSQYASLPHWEAKAFIVKHGDFVLQEQFVMQLIIQFQKIWEQEELPLRLLSYKIMALSYQSGLIEVVPNAISLDKLKQYREGSENPNLLSIFRSEWPDHKDFEKARANFVSSLAAYSIICYFLQIKDRHNGNIMLESEGILFHIDFGYLLARTIKFEKAPFKLTDEFIEVMGGDQSKYFKDYCMLCIQGFIAVRKHYEKILLMVEMTTNDGGAIPCLDRETITKNLRKRFYLHWNEAQCEEFVMNLICDARDNWRTQIYDTYQRILNDIH